MVCPFCNQKMPDTWREKLATWFINHIVPQTLKSERTDARMEGFSEGYRLSGKVGQEIKETHAKMARIEFELQQLILQVIKNNFPNV